MGLLQCEDKRVNNKMVEFGTLGWGNPFESADGLFIKVNEYEGFEVRDCECMSFDHGDKVFPREAKIIFE